MEIRSATFVCSSQKLSQCPSGGLPEFAFIGRSNVGKSSLINMLTDNSSLAKVSSTPGKTRLINHFRIDERWYLVDLPGYGYARAPKEEQAKWGVFLEDYLRTEKRLVHVLLLVDLRHDPTADDRMLADFFYRYRIPFSVIATKEDKVRRSDVRPRLNAVAAALKLGVDNVFSVSSVEKRGKEKVLALIEHILDAAKAAEAVPGGESQETL